jgi:hypothetical protein
MTRAEAVKLASGKSEEGYSVKCTSKPLRNMCIVFFPPSVSPHTEAEYYFDDAGRVGAMLLD